MADCLLAKTLGVVTTRTQANRILELQWSAPPFNSFKLNIDGCLLGNPGCSRAREIIRATNGTSLFAYAFYEGVGTNFMAEFAALFHGLKCAIAKEIKNLIIECDSPAVVICVQKEAIPWCFQQMWWHCKGYLDKISWSIVHCYCQSQYSGRQIRKTCNSNTKF
ncbi:uncharacterized protein LOC122065449 [Macadamia integrifolia]|uniref:uncharacterized protein LOC122065449 n=1 Tax=Macadamia integrifolia TaxID=60698 RepID=UPI001C4FF462|nr:uncharacterized protein LOC122065449 [Macadamia integrifolia]